MSPYALKLVLSFVIGGIWIALTTAAAERFGSRLGGVLGGLPSTVVVALGSIGWAQGVDAARAATDALPVAFAINCAFMVTYAALVPRGQTLGMGVAAIVWTGLQAVLALLGAPRYAIALAIWVVALTAAYVILDRVLNVRTDVHARVRPTARQIALRAVLSGLVIAGAVGLSRLGGPVFGAIMASFPAVYTATLIITARSAGTAFSRALVLPLMVSGVFNCVVFATMFRLSVLGIGLLPAMAAAYLVSIGSAFATHRFLKRDARPS